MGIGETLVQGTLTCLERLLPGRHLTLGQGTGGKTLVDVGQILPNIYIN